MVRFTYLLLLIILTAESCVSGKFETDLKSSASQYFQVTKIVDGDTFWVDNGTEKGLKIRFIGIDAPEARRMFNGEVGYYGKEAKVYLTSLLTGKKVKLVSDVDSLDRYGRTLAYVYLEDGTFVNAELIKNGYAVLMTVPPNIQFAEYFAKLQREARDNGRGLWEVDKNSASRSMQ